MANYPKITGNSNAAKLDRPTGLNAQNFFEIKLTDSTTSKEYIYGVVIIEGGGDANTEVSISDIKIKNASGVAMSSFETTGANFRSNAAIQDALFCLSPLKKNGAASWIADKPFMGVVKANYTSYEQIKTADWTVATGDAGLPQAYFDAVGVGPLAYIKVNKNLALGEIDTINDASTNFSDAEFIIPIYNHAYIKSNPIPTGEYAAILIKADLTAGLFEGQVQNTLHITHDAIVESTNSNANYSIRLDVNGSNIFVFGSSFVGSNFTQSDSEVSSTLFKTIKHINQDLYTGTSWHAKDSTNPLVGITYDAATDALYNGNEVATSGGENFTGIQAELYDNNDILTAWNANGDIFNEAELTVFDASSLTGDFLFSTTASTGNLFFSQSSAILPTAENKTTVSSGLQESLIFKHRKIDNSTLYESGTFLRQVEKKGHDGSTYSFYNNFTVDSIKRTDELQIIAEQNGTFTKTVTVNYCVYPQFTYGTTALNIFDTINNFVLNSGRPNKQEVAHASDEFIKLATPNSQYCPIAPNNGFYGDVDGVAQVPLTVKHNVRINVLNDEDVLGSHAINKPGGYYKGDGSVKVFLASNENEVLVDTSGAETTAVPTVSQQKLDYTVEVVNANYVVNKDVGFTDFLPRNADGSYQNMDKEGGYYLKSEEFIAPITNWQPGYRHGQTWGTQRIPYYHNVYATGKTYKQQSAFFAARPLLHIEHQPEVSNIVAVDDFIHETSLTYIDRLEFVGVPGLTPTVANNENGLKDFGTNSYRETSKKFTCSASSNTDRITNFATGLGSKTDSQIPGAEVFGLESFFGEGRHFIGSSGFTADSGSTPGFTKLVKEDGTAAVCILTSTADNITCTFGKPTLPATVKRANFPFPGGLATSDLRSRVFRPYGFDLTCNVNTDIGNVIPLDVFVPTGDLVGNGASASGAHTGSTTVLNTKYTANANGTDGTATVDILDLDPKELGITYNGSTEIKSARFIKNNEYGEVDGTSIPVFYSTLDSNDLKDGVYTRFMKFNFFNLGLEDVLIKNVNLFDPIYLPADNFTVKPPAASDPVWSIYEAQAASSSAVNVGTAKSFQTTDLNTNNLLLSQDALIYKLGRRNLDFDTAPSGTVGTHVITKFQVNASSAAGTYFQGLEVEYYRDEGVTQHSRVNNDVTVRPLANRRVWKTRVLLKVIVNERSTINVQDADGTSVNTDGTLVFGTIQV
jgi:hypothetical protein